MYKKYTVSFFVSVCILLSIFSCTYQYTKEFIAVFPPQELNEAALEIDGWFIDVPGVVAYKNLKNLNSVDNPDNFWVTLRTRYPLQKNSEFNGTLEIDSIGIVFYGIDSSLLKEVTPENHSEVDFVLSEGHKAILFNRVDTIISGHQIESIDSTIYHHFSSEYFQYSYSYDSKSPSVISKSPISIKGSVFNNDVLNNDSLFVENAVVWRSPSRVAPFVDSRKKFHHIAFDFFRDKGVEIPDDIVRIKIFFDLSLVGTSGNNTERQISFNMLKHETSEQIPFMVQ